MKLAYAMSALCCVMSAASGQWLEDTIRLPNNASPVTVCYSTVGKKVYCGNQYPLSVTVISGAENRVVKNIMTGYLPRELCHNPRNNKIYSSCDGPVLVIDGTADVVVDTVAVGEWPTALCYDSLDNKLYCANTGGQSVTAIDGVTNEVTATIVTGIYPFALCHCPSPNKVYCANTTSDNVTVIDPTNDSVTATLAAGHKPTALCYNALGNKLYCANAESDDVTIYDCATDSVITTVPAGRGPFNLCYNPENNKVYCSNISGGTITVIDGSADTVITTISTQSQPTDFIYNPRNNKVYCVCAGSVTVIDGLTNEVLRNIGLPAPYSICYNPDENRSYITNFAYQHISVLRDSMHSSIEEPRGPARVLPRATLLAGTIWLPDQRLTEPEAAKSSTRLGGFLLDASGRRVMDLSPGPNSVRHLAGGVYFACVADGVATPIKVVIAR